MARACGSTVGRVFSSASSSINGHKVVELQCSLSGGATASLRGEARHAGGELQLTSLQVSAGGRAIDVAIGADAGDDVRRGGDGDEVIDVEAW
jgi:hypothetical protein